MEETSNIERQFVSLQPFIHQVGGHSSMLCIDEAKLCKPVVEREQLFYETLPESLKPFVPSYHGIIKVHLFQEGGYITLKAVSPDNYNPKPASSLKCVRLRRSGSVELEKVPALFESDSSKGDDGVSMNPWTKKCLKQYIGKLTAQLEGEQNPLDFIVLENLTYRFRLPCILDLKMGTRQYGDNDCLAKRQSKMVKVITTTSAKLGVRIGGMQVYQASSGKFLCRNKLYGRTLSPAGFKNAVHSFLHDGVRLRTDAVPPLISRLEALRSTLAELGSVRLYTTSLLLLYEGHDTVCGENKPESGSVKMKVNKSEVESRMNEEVERAERASSVDRKNGLLGVPQEDFRLRTSSCSPKERKHLRPVEFQEEEPLTDVRIIDFAHSTHSGMGDKVIYTGSDNGFLFGLNNIIQILKTILMESQ